MIVIRRYSSRLLGGLLPLFLLGCSSAPVSQPAVADQRVTASQPPDTELFYELLVGEFAVHRNNSETAVASYLRAAERSRDVRVVARAADLAMRSHRWRDANQAAERWLELDPDAVEPHGVVARAAMWLGDAEGAAEAFAEVVRRQGADPALTLSEIASMLQQEPADVPAADVLQSLKARFPDSTALSLGLARVLLRQQERDNALGVVDATLNREPHSVEVLMLRAEILIEKGQGAEAIADVRKRLDNADSNTDVVPLRLGLARLLAETGRYDEMQPELDRLFTEADGDPTVLLTIGLLALDARRMEAATRYLDALLATGEFTDEAHYYLARIHDQRHAGDKAIKHYEQVRPGDMYITAQIRIAELLARRGELRAGRERLRELAQVLSDPSFQPELVLAEARMLQQADQLDEAVALLSDALAEFPDHPDLLYARALAADQAGDSEQLVSDLEQLIALDPENAHAMNALGYHYADHNLELEQAETYLVKANRLKPNDAAILDSLGWLRYRQGRLKDALRLLNKAYDMFPDGEIAAHLGEVMWMMGDESAAREVWQEALLDSPDHAVLNRVIKRFNQ